MKKQNRPNKKLASPPPEPVMHGNAFHTFISEAQSIGNELAARRVFDADACEYLAAKDLAADFETWRAAKRA